MSPQHELSPPRPIAPGDVVAGYSDELGEWTAAQITGLNQNERTAGVVYLNWSGAEPSSLDELGPLEPLRLTHHAHRGQLEHCIVTWLLPRSCKVIGSAPVLVDGRSNSYAGWQMGLHLDMQRRWDAGDRSWGARPWERTFSGAEFNTLMEPPSGVWSLAVRDVVDLDGRRIVRLFPDLKRLMLFGKLGTFENADALNELGSLKGLLVANLFGMRAVDCPRPTSLEHLDSLWVYSVPAEYASAVRRAWTPEILNGTDLRVTSPRNPGWVAENRDNPLRDWDGREHISSGRYKKAVVQYRATRAAVLDALSNERVDVQLGLIGRAYGEAFNRLDGSRNHFIETEEREELFAALLATVDFAEATLGREFPDARGQLKEGLESVRSW
jgi:hypothetical protein